MTNWKVGGAIAGLAIVLAAGASISALSSTAHPKRAEWRKAYVRPAEIPFPNDNPYSEAKARLGQMLFFDPLLSGSKTQSCATCHNPALSWTDNLPRGVGTKVMGTRTPTLLNIAWVPKPGWVGQFKDLEAVAFRPITADGIMNLPEKTLIERLSAIPAYVDAFDAVYGEGDITRRKIELALATYQRAVVSSEAPFDRWIKGDEKAVSEAAKRGFDVFNGKAACAECHNGWSFTDASFHDIGVGKDKDIGRGKLFPTSSKLQYAFKTPTLRDVARRAPYMHDGSIATLAAVVDLYDRGGIDRPSRSDNIKPLRLTKSEKADLIAFMQTLTGDPEKVDVPQLPR
ncbi:MAG: cytochrome-c peroxidase [Pseudolabrys sp.]